MLGRDLDTPALDLVLLLLFSLSACWATDYYRRTGVQPNQTKAAWDIASRFRTLLMSHTRAKSTHELKATRARHRIKVLDAKIARLGAFLLVATDGSANPKLAGQV